MGSMWMAREWEEVKEAPKVLNSVPGIRRVVNRKGEQKRKGQLHLSGWKNREHVEPSFWNTIQGNYILGNAQFQESY